MLLSLTPRLSGVISHAITRSLAATCLIAGALVACARPPAALPSAAAGASAASTSISQIRYDVTVDTTTVTRHQIDVTMRFHVNGSGPVVLSLPAWSPGHYTLLWFARRVWTFAATANGLPLEWKKLDYQTWQIETTGATSVEVSFQYLANTIDRAVAWTQPGFSFFNGTNLFLYPANAGFDWPATVVVHTSPSWRVATGMLPAGEPNTFTATNYHDLVDMPFFVGHFDIDSAWIAGRWVRFASYPEGSFTPERRTRTFGWLAKILPAEAAVFRDIPWQTYTIFQIADTVVNGGGLEHQNSQLDEVTLRALDAPGLSGLYAHEMFHSWNVKRLRPADLVPYRYTDAQPTPWLWVSEGLTDYYGSLARVRGGIIDSSAFLDGVAAEVTQVMRLPPVALGDASLSVWIDPTDGTAGIYYGKGALVGFLLDIAIRDASDNHHSLDDVMRDLYDEVYKQTWRGFTRDDWWGAVSRAAGGKSFAEFARRYVDGRDPLPLDSVFALAGLRMTTDTIPASGAASGSERPRVRAHIVPIPDAPARAVRIRDGILRGEVNQ